MCVCVYMRVCVCVHACVCLRGGLGLGGRGEVRCVHRWPCPAELTHLREAKMDGCCLGDVHDFAVGSYHEDEAIQRLQSQSRETLGNLLRIVLLPALHKLK